MLNERRNKNDAYQAFRSMKLEIVWRNTPAS